MAPDRVKAGDNEKPAAKREPALTGSLGDIGDTTLYSCERPAFAVILAAVEQAWEEPWAQWRDRHGDWGRDLVLSVARPRCGLRLHELGAAVGGLDYRSVGTALRNFEHRLQQDRSLAKLAEEIKAQFKKKEMCPQFLIL
jgi:hypothetical protein